MTESAPGSLSRQELYDRIRESSKDEYILEEMKRLGFWPKDEAEPSVAEQVITKIGELERELNELFRQQALVSDPEKALKEMRKQRMKEARERREETRQRNMEARYQRALDWYRRNQSEITHLGDTVSGGLGHNECNTEKLAKFALPSFENAQALAQAMGIKLGELRFLAYTRPASAVHHYRQFEIPKKTGGTRLISTPMPRLKRAQYWILDNLLNRIPLHNAAHGFVNERSIVTNARPHLQSELVINLDLKDFFPSITYPRVKGYLQKTGYSGEIATILALLCTEPEMDEIELDGELYYVARGERRLPQGAPTSPAISNILCYRMDRRIQGAVEKLGFTYTRYADDITLSSKAPSDENLKKVFWRVHQIIANEGFTVHPDKTRIMRKGAKHEVTGIIVNDKPGIDRKTLRRFKACLHQAKLDGIDGKSWGNTDNFLSAIYGFANYIRMVDPAKGEKFLAQVKDIQAKHQLSINNKTPDNSFRQKAAGGEAPGENWWQPAQKPEPEREAPRPEEIAAQKALAETGSEQDGAGSQSAAASTTGDGFNQSPGRRQQRETRRATRRRSGSDARSGQVVNWILGLVIAGLIVYGLFKFPTLTIYMVVILVTLMIVTRV